MAWPTATEDRLLFPIDVEHRSGGQRPPESALKRERTLLARQFGLIRRDQALDAGFTSRNIDGKIRRKEWRALYRGVYVDTSFPSTWQQSVLAAVFRGGPGTVASGTCAAALLELPGFRLEGVEVTSPRQMRDVPFRAHVGDLPPDLQTMVGPIPCTRADRTLLDVANRVSQQHLEDALDDALRRNLTSLPKLKGMVNRLDGRGRSGIERLRRAIRERDDGRPIPESVLESRLWRPLHHLGAPRPERQLAVSYEGIVYRIDYAFPHAMVAIEAHGYRWHASKKAWDHDREKTNIIQLLGWRPFVVTWKDLYDPAGKAFNQLRQLLIPPLFEN